MYGWVWRHLPGPWPIRLLMALVLLAAVIVILFTAFFPWLSERLPMDEVTISSLVPPR
jgi:hypothetical protein